ncbi:Zinc finger bed domain-containing protein daysleeper [Thalictrum thalictroides]|uniref:Zinc finger bed domain-containing protein daysleeper n=1 Tax=Thalictrum thalictroides TaxID=46969 RepID=A0A7J6WQT4_THATH|nr:Zinc finger bed domain-containing protein daysleeper [Thalictrum thalictroides]
MVFDPRRKMEYVSFCFKELYGDSIAKVMLDKVNHELIELFNFYASLYPSLGVRTQSQSQASIVVDDGDDDEDVVAIVSRFQKHLEEKEDLTSKSEVERYLGEHCEKGGDVFDILDWWKNNSTRYKVLSQIVRDVLAVPVSSVASENAFSMGG